MLWLYVLITLLLGLLLYTYVLFPLLMAWLAGEDRTETGRADDLPSVTLIVPAYNEELVIEAKLRNALSLDYPKLQVLLASDGSEDATVRISQSIRDDRLGVLRFEPRRGKASVVNDAVAQATGEAICLCDANVLFRADALRFLSERLEHSRVGAVSGDVRLQSQDSSFGWGEILYYWVERKIHRGESRFGAMMGVDGGMYLIRRELFRSLASDTILDDFTITMNVLRAGREVIYEPRAIAEENATESATSEYKRRVRIGAGAAQVLKRGAYPRLNQPLQLWLFLSHKGLRWLSPWMLLGLTFLLALGAAAHPWCQILLLGGLVLGGLAALGGWSSRLRRHWLFAVPFYFVISQIAMGQGLLQGLLVGQSAMWERTARSTPTPLGEHKTINE